MDHMSLTLPSEPKGFSSTIKNRCNPTLQDKINHLRLPIYPIYPLPSGPPHPKFPKNLLEFWLLSEPDCDSIARYYHQLSPTNPWHNLYPSNMNWDADFLKKPDPKTMDDEEMEILLSEEDRVWVKKRMVGKFIGFTWCATPTAEVERKVQWLSNLVRVKVRREREIKERLEAKEFRGDKRWAW